MSANLGKYEWQQELQNAYSSISDLLMAGLISKAEADHLTQLRSPFKVRITPYYASLMTEDRSTCPIRMQAIPHLFESDPVLPQWATDLSQEAYGRPTPWDFDAIGDVKNLAAPRITHRYPNRAILHLSSTCAVYCRFCFRKTHLSDQERTLYEGTLDPAFEYIAQHPELSEIILTGGDPLSTSDAAFLRVLERFSAIPHVKVVRIHSRMAVTLPSRFSPPLLEILGKSWSFKIALVSHFNHPCELTESVRLAFDGLRRAGVMLFNQSVLLKGINDSADGLRQLFQGLYEQGVAQIYLHHPDWTPETFHFRVSIERGKEIYAALRGQLSSPALPHYVVEIPQGFGKTQVDSPRFRLLKQLPVENGISGALYEALSPHTRASGSTPERHLYLDLHPV